MSRLTTVASRPLLILAILLSFLCLTKVLPLFTFFDTAIKTDGLKQQEKKEALLGPLEQKSIPSALPESDSKKESHCAGDEPTRRLLRNTRLSKDCVRDEPYDERWVGVLCPEVKNYLELLGTGFMCYPKDGIGALMTKKAQASAICLLRIVDMCARSQGLEWFLHAGAHLGAVIHGGPIPWDDDVDVFVPLSGVKKFRSCINGISVSHLNLTTKTYMSQHSSLKVFLSGYPSTGYPWNWPFIDVFFYAIRNGFVEEVHTSGKIRRPSLRWNVSHFFPPRTYFFSGLLVPGPSPTVAKDRYNFSRCIVSRWTHRQETTLRFPGSLKVDCCSLSKHFPFVKSFKTTDTVYVKDKALIEWKRDADSQDLLEVKRPGQSQDWTLTNYRDIASNFTIVIPVRAYSMDLIVTKPSFETRRDWRNLVTSIPWKGQELTDQISSLNSIEIQNGISSSQCLEKTQPLRVVVFNAERGRHWLTLAHLIRARTDTPDVIILNEMDIGMARSRNEHTTRLLAHALEMNYVWGLEFVELTSGTFEEQRFVGKNGTNLWGLHGNAILSRHPLLNAKIFRDPLKKIFFSTETKKSENAFGAEIRLGGRMGMVAEIPYCDTDEKLFVGSIHKIEANSRALIKSHINGRRCVIGGDQHWDFCTGAGLRHVDNKKHHTWPASCSSYGRGRGDIICSNLQVHEREQTVLPCFGNIAIGDHAMTFVTLK